MMQVMAWDAVMANQYLADKGAISPEYPYMLQDLTPSEELDDIEATDKRWHKDGPRARLDRHGYVEWVEPGYLVSKRTFVPAKLDATKALSPKVTEEDVERARERFRRLNPEYGNLVDRGGI